MREYERQGLTQSEYSEIHQWLRKNTDEVRACDHCGVISIRTANALKRGYKYEKKL